MRHRGLFYFPGFLVFPPLSCVYKKPTLRAMPNLSNGSPLKIGPIIIRPSIKFFLLPARLVRGALPYSITPLSQFFSLQPTHKVGCKSFISLSILPLSNLLTFMVLTRRTLASSFIILSSLYWMSLSLQS